MNNTIRGALLFATAIIAFAVPARAGAENHPSTEACIAYAEADAAYDAASNKADATRSAAMKEAGVVRQAALNAAMNKAEAARKAAWNEAYAAYGAAFDKAEAAYNAAMKEAGVVRLGAYTSIYKEDGGKQSSMVSITIKLVLHSRATCRYLYGI